MEIQQIRYVLAVARTGGQTKAREELGREQSTITNAVAKLEKELGVELFERDAAGRRTSSLTAEGRRLVELAAPLVSRWDELRNDYLTGTDGELRGSVRVGANVAALYLLPAIVRDFRRKHRKVELTIHSQPVDTTVRLLRAGELDIGLRAPTDLPPGLHFTPLTKVERVVIASREHELDSVDGRITLEHLAQYEFVTPSRTSSERRTLESAFKAQGHELRVSIEARSTDVTKRLVREGLGLAVVPIVVLEPHDYEYLRVLRVPEVFSDYEYGILHLSNWKPSKAVEEFASFLTSCLKDQTVRSAV